MPTTPATPTAPWRPLFLKHTSLLKPFTTFTLATLTQTSSNTNTTTTTSFSPSHAPRARTVGFRGFFAPARLDSDLLTFSTDARMGKTLDILRLAGGTAADAAERFASGGGGSVEAVFWVGPGVKAAKGDGEELGKEAESVNVQWRVRGDAWVVGADDEEGVDGDGLGSVTKAVEGWVRRGQGDEEEGKGEEVGGWRWSDEVRKSFEKHSPGLKGSFKAPPPGTEKSKVQIEGAEKGAKVESLDDDIARKNFRLAIIRPFEVEFLNLSDPKNPERVIWEYQKDGSWKNKDLWP